MRKQRKEEEKRIIAQMEEALREQEKNEEKESTIAPTETWHCRRCRALMENGVCPNCGMTMYVPMSAEKRRKIQKITTLIGFAVFFLLLLILEWIK